MTRDELHLKWLAIAHYIFGGFSAVCSCFPFIHVALGIAWVTGSVPDKSGEAMPPAFGWFFIVGGAVAILVGWSYSLGTLLVGYLLNGRRGYTFCIVMSVISILNMPIGTMLGAFTMAVLFRPSVQALFAARTPKRVDELA